MRLNNWWKERNSSEEMFRAFRNLYRRLFIVIGIIMSLYGSLSICLVVGRIVMAGYLPMVMENRRVALQLVLVILHYAMFPLLAALILYAENRIFARLENGRWLSGT